MVRWLKRVGGTLAIVIGVVLLWRGLLFFVVVMAIAGAGVHLADRWRQWRVVRRFRAVWGTQGKDLLLVYSNSPHWQRYIEETWLPKWGHRAVVLNWSERRHWDRAKPEVVLFRTVAGAREFNPIGIVVPVAGRHTHVVRFWLPFRDYKHGKDRRLKAAEAELDQHLDAIAGRAARDGRPVEQGGDA